MWIANLCCFASLGLYFPFFAATSTSQFSPVRMTSSHYVLSTPNFNCTLLLAGGNAPSPHPETSEQNIKIQAVSLYFVFQEDATDSAFNLCWKKIQNTKHAHQVPLAWCRCCLQGWRPSSSTWAYASAEALFPLDGSCCRWLPCQ